MTFGERIRRDNEQSDGAFSTGPGPDGGNLEGRRRAGEDFLAAGDEAIKRALSGDSQRFLEANRQRGGQ